MAKKKSSAPTKAVAARAAAPSATATHRTLVAIVSHAQRDAAEAALAAFDAANNTGFSGAFVPWIPGWDGIEEPQPEPMCWFQNPQWNSLAVAAQYVAAMGSLSIIGVRVYEGIVVPAEVGNPSNTVDSIYSSGYNASLPVFDGFAGIAAWSLDVVGSLPPRGQLP